MNFSELDNLIDKFPEMGLFAADIAVMKDNKIIHRKSVGFSDYENTVPISENNIYWCVTYSRCRAVLTTISEQEALANI